MSSDTKLLPLPPHPEGVAWPTESWPDAQLDPRADRATLEKILDHAFSLPEPEDIERAVEIFRKIGARLDIDEARIPRRTSLAYDQILDEVRAGRVRALWVIATNGAH